MKNKTAPRIFVSYSHADVNMARRVEQDLSPLPLDIVRDERSAGYTEDLESYMKLIRKTDYTLILVSDAFLRSTPCMFEISEFLKDEDYQERILPVVIQDYEIDGDARKGAIIYGDQDIAHYIRYWETKADLLNPSFRIKKTNPLITAC